MRPGIESLRILDQFLKQKTMDFRVVFLAKVISAQTFEKKNLVEFGMKVISEATSLMGITSDWNCY